jgi:RimJ/RimL family protein N-acetyltransferase
MAAIWPDPPGTALRETRSRCHCRAVHPVLEVPEQRGRLVRLEPLRVGHVDALVAAAEEDYSSFAWTSVPRTPAAMAHQVETLLEAQRVGDTIPFVQVQQADGRPVGMTRYLTLRWQPSTAQLDAVEIGGTWLAASAQRRGINLEAKLLLLTYAFEVWGVGRVDFKTDARNDRSRAAIAGLGATFEGVLRNWQPSHAMGEEGLLRDTAGYSIITEDWPAALANLVGRIG